MAENSRRGLRWLSSVFFIPGLWLIAWGSLKCATGIGLIVLGMMFVILGYPAFILAEDLASLVIDKVGAVSEIGRDGVKFRPVDNTAGIRSIDMEGNIAKLQATTGMTGEQAIKALDAVYSVLKEGHEIEEE